jgi:hypothetical protein
MIAGLTEELFFVAAMRQEYAKFQCAMRALRLRPQGRVATLFKKFGARSK